MTREAISAEDKLMDIALDHWHFITAKFAPPAAARVPGIVAGGRLRR